MLKKRVLVVDDDENDGYLTQLALRSVQYDSDFVFRFMDALTQLQREKYFAVLIDRNIVGESVDTSQIRRIDPNLVLIAYTGSEPKFNETPEQIKYGCDHFVKKEIGIKETARTLKSILDSFVPKTQTCTEEY